MEHLETTLQIAAHIVTIVGLPLAGLVLFLESRRAGKARDVETVVNVSETLRTRWEGGWSDELPAIEAARREGRPLTAEQEQALIFMLNWVHWLGAMFRSGLVARPDTILLAIGPVMGRMIAAGQTMVDRDESEHGQRYWAGVRDIEQRLAKLTR